LGWYFGHDGELIVLTTARPSEASYRMAVRDYFRSTEVELLERKEHEDILKPGRLGIAAFAIAAAALSIDFLLSEIVIASRLGGGSSLIESSQVFGWADALPWILGSVAVAMGIVGLFRRSPAKIFPILGIVIGVWLVCSSLALNTYATTSDLPRVGVGVKLNSEDGYAKVTEIMPGSPAQKEGHLQVGDRIIAVAQGERDFIDVRGMNQNEIVSLIRGKKGDTVRLKIIPANAADPSQEKVVVIVRDTLK